MGSQLPTKLCEQPYSVHNSVWHPGTLMSSCLEPEEGKGLHCSLCQQPRRAVRRRLRFCAAAAERIVKEERGYLPLELEASSGHPSVGSLDAQN